MRDAGVGLTRVQNADLKKVLAALHHEQVSCPLNVIELTRIGLQHCAQEILHTLRGLDARATQAVLVAVLAERMATDKD